MRADCATAGAGRSAAAPKQAARQLCWHGLAMNLAIDRQLLVRALWDGKALVPNSHQYPSFGALYNPNRHGTAYDPKRAKELLKEAGYKGQEIIYSTRANYYLNALPAAQAILEMWRKVGIHARLNIVEDTAAVPPDQKMVRNWSNSTRYPDPSGALWNLWEPYFEGQRSGEWNNAAFNALGAELDKTTDTKERYTVFQKMLDIWEDDAPGTILYQPLETYGVRKSLKWQPYTFYYMDLRAHNLQDTAAAR
jgi:peptide/nickel transport system substrate-binding protein